MWHVQGSRGPRTFYLRFRGQVRFTPTWAPSANSAPANERWEGGEPSNLNKGKNWVMAALPRKVQEQNHWETRITSMAYFLISSQNSSYQSPSLHIFKFFGCSGSSMHRLKLPHSMWDLSSLTRDWTHVPCIGRWVPNHWTTREVPTHLFLLLPPQKSEREDMTLRYYLFLF